MRLPDPALFAPYQGRMRTEVPLGTYSYALCGGPCAVLFETDGAEMLRDLASACIRGGLPCRVLGGLSNVLVSDDGFDGVILLNRKGTISHETHPDGTVDLFAEAGTLMGQLVRYCEENGISGLEWAAGLPGTLGGAVIGNAGAFGGDIASIFIGTDCLDRNGQVTRLDRDGMAFAYRASALKGTNTGSVLLSAALRLEKGIPEQIREKGDACRERRRSSQPYGQPSLGSVFRNPEGMSAGKLIEDAGLKGTSVGKAVVSEKHANFIVTEKGVRAADYLALVDLVRDRVLENSGVLLEPEIELLGFRE